MVPTISRRDLLTCLAAAGLALGRVPPAGNRTDDELEDWVRANLPIQDLATLGRAYREAHPEESTVDALLARLLRNRRAGQQLGDLVRDAVAADFKALAIENLDGWLLARTEGRLAALASLLL